MMNFTITPVPHKNFVNITCPYDNCEWSLVEPIDRLKQECWSVATLISGMEFSNVPRNVTNPSANAKSSAWLAVPAAEIILRLADVSKTIPDGANLTDTKIIEEFGLSWDVANSISQMSFWSGIWYGPVNNATGNMNASIPAFLVLDELEARFDTHEYRNSILPELMIASTIITGLMVGLRFWSRRATADGVRSFDWIILLGWVITLAWGAVAVAQTYYLDDSDRGFMIKFFIAIDVLYPLALFTIKSSILLFYYRLTMWKSMKGAVVFTFIFAFASTVIGIAMGIVTYTRNFYFMNLSFVDNSFEKKPMRYNCAIAAASLIIGTDVIIWLLPLPMLKRLQLTTREKVLAFLTFGLGSLACIASGFRLRSMLLFLEPQMLQVDLFETSVEVNIWGLVELNMGIICASVPALRVLVSRYLPRLSGNTSNSAGTSSNKMKTFKLGTGTSRSGGSTSNTEQDRQSECQPGTVPSGLPTTPGTRQITRHDRIPARIGTPVRYEEI